MLGVASRFNLRPTRGTAFTIHLLLSILIFSTLVAMMLVYWYPGDLFFMDGGWEGLKLVAMVDLVLGPALTLVVFKPGKPSLKFDLSLIAALQVAALGYGFYTTYQQRTVAVVFAEDGFTTISASAKKAADAKIVEMDLTPGALPASGAFSVPLAMTPAIDDFSEYFVGLLNGEPAAYERSDQYVEIGTYKEYMQDNIWSATRLRSLGVLDEIESAANGKRVALEDIEVYKLNARYANGYALYDPQEKRIVEFVSVSSQRDDSDVAESEE